MEQNPGLESAFEATKKPRDIGRQKREIAQRRVYMAGDGSA